MEFVLSVSRPFLKGKISYTLSHASEGHWRYIQSHLESLPHYPRTDYPLDFDQRHRIFIRTEPPFPSTSFLRSRTSWTSGMSAMSILPPVFPTIIGVRVSIDQFIGGLTLFDRGYYHPGKDLNHDGYVTREEAYLSYLRANQISIDTGGS